MELRTANGPVPNVEFGELRPEQVQTQWTIYGRDSVNFGTLGTPKWML